MDVIDLSHPGLAVRRECLDRAGLCVTDAAKAQLYTTACVLASPRTAADTGEYAALSEMTSLTTFVTTLAGHIAAETARARCR